MSKFDRCDRDRATPKYGISAITMAAALTVAAASALAGEVETTRALSSQSGFVLASTDSSAPVACRLPGQIRKLGRSITFVAPSRIVRIGHEACAARGGRPASG